MGYTYNPKTNNYKKAKIRIEKVLGSLYLNSIYNGNTETWHTAGGSVYKIDKQYGSEPEFIRDNFDWKVVTAVVGTIYFNY